MPRHILNILNTMKMLKEAFCFCHKSNSRTGGILDLNKRKVHQDAYPNWIHKKYAYWSSVTICSIKIHKFAIALGIKINANIVKM